MARVLSPAAPQGVPRGAEVTDRRRPAGRRTAAAVLLCYLLAAVAVTWRLWADPAVRTVAGNPGDADLFAWFMRYAATAVAHGRLPAMVTSALNAPAGINVMWNTSLLLPCVLLAPVTLLFGPQTSLTVLATAGFAGSAASLFWVLRRWQVSTGAAALAGAVYGFSPALLHSSIGHYNLQFAVLPPLIIDAGLRVAIGQPGLDPAGLDPAGLDPAGLDPAGLDPAGLDPARQDPAGLAGDAGSRWRAPIPAPVRDGCTLGLLVTAQLFTGEELLLITGMAGLLLVAGLAAGRPRAALRRLRPAAAGLLTAVGITAGLAGWALRAQFFGPLTEHGSAFLADYFVNDLTGFVTASGYQLFHSAASGAAAARYRGGPPEYLAYLGWPLIAVLAIATLVCWRRPAVRATGLTLAVLELLSLGGHPLVGGTSDPGVNLPWHWLEAVPVLGSALANRLSIVADGVAAALLALSLDLVRGLFPPARRQAAAVVVCTLAVIASLPLLPRPLPAASPPGLPAGWSAAFTTLRLPAGARVLVVPVPTPTLTAAMRWQADTGQPESLIGGYFIGPAADGQAYIAGNGVTATARYLDQLWISGLTPGAQATAAGVPAARSAAISPPGPAQVRADLAAWRPAAVLAVTTLGSPLGRYLVRLFGRPEIRAGDVLAWRR